MWILNIKNKSRFAIYQNEFFFRDCLGETSEMSDTGNDEQIDVGSVVEAVSADHSFGAPLYVVESMCMRCGENARLFFSYSF